jgi:hypothetical protein
MLNNTLVDHLISIYEIVFAIMNKRRDESLQLFGILTYFMLQNVHGHPRKKI